MPERMPISIVALLEQVQLVERLALDASENVRWAPLTALFVLASSSWVKAPLFVAAGMMGDIHARRRFPLVAALALAVATVGSVLAALLKEAFDRQRPAAADPGIDPLVNTPGSPSFPSGHAATAFAAAALVGAFYPRLRIPLYGVAVLVALSRVYLGVHFWLDIAAGAVIGLAVGLAAAAATRRLRS
jgi:undecaprenyl-diphosphatase